MKTLYLLLRRWYRTKLLRYEPIYDVVQAEALLKEIEERFALLLTHEDEAVRLIAASRAQYVAQSRQRPLYSRMVLELLCMAMLLPLVCYWWGRSLRVPAGQEKERVDGLRLMHKPAEYYHIPPELAQGGLKTIIPKQRYLRRRDVLLLLRSAWLMMTKMRMKFRDQHVSGMVQHWLKLASEMARLRPSFDRYDTPFFMVYVEYDCSISFQTLLCHCDQVQLYDVIHGDHLYGMADPFFQVDRCYCYHPFYVELFERQWVKADFRLFENPNFSMTSKEMEQPYQGVGVVMPHPVYHDEAAGSFEEFLVSFAQALNQRAEQEPVTLRPHPSYPEHYAKMQPYLSEKVQLSDPHAESAREFVVRHEVVLGTFSALLLEAAMMGRKVQILDSAIIRQIASYHFVFQEENVQLGSLDLRSVS